MNSEQSREYVPSPRDSEKSQRISEIGACSELR
jgi:hypothetical protein